MSFLCVKRAIRLAFFSAGLFALLGMLSLGCSTTIPQSDLETDSSEENIQKNERIFPRDPLPVEVPFRIWSRSHFDEKEPVSFWVESKESMILQFQIFPCEHHPFQSGLKKMVAQHQQVVWPGLQKVEWKTSLGEGFFVLKVLHWDWLAYIPFSSSSLKPYWSQQKGRYSVVFPTVSSSTNILFAGKAQKLTEPLLTTSEERFALENPPCYFSLPASISETPLAVPKPSRLFSDPTFWRVLFPEQSLRYEALWPEKSTTNSSSSFALVGLLDTHFLPAPGKVKLKLQLLGSSRVSKTQQVSISILTPTQKTLAFYPLQEGELREEFSMTQPGFHQIQVEFQGKELLFPVWVGSGPRSGEYSQPVQFSAHRISSKEALIFLQSAYPGTFLFHGNELEPFKVSFTEAGFQVKQLPLSQNVTSLTLFSPFEATPQTIVLKMLNNFSQQWTPEIEVWRDNKFSFDWFSIHLGWSTGFFSRFPQKSYLPYPKKTPSAQEEWIQSVLLESTSLMEKLGYARAEEILRQACLLLPEEPKFKRLYHQALEKLLLEHQISLPSQKLSLSWKGKPIVQLIETLREQTQVPLEAPLLLDPVDFSCQEQSFVEVLARLLIEKKMRVQIEVGSVSFQKEKNMVNSGPSPSTEERPGPFYRGPLTAGLTSSNEFFFWQDPHSICYGMISKLD